MMNVLRKVLNRLRRRLDFGAGKADARKARRAGAAKRPPKRKRRR